jgi:hypothetical protein
MPKIRFYLEVDTSSLRIELLEREYVQDQEITLLDPVWADDEHVVTTLSDGAGNRLKFYRGVDGNIWFTGVGYLPKLGESRFGAYHKHILLRDAEAQTEKSVAKGLKIGWRRQDNPRYCVRAIA